MRIKAAMTGMIIVAAVTVIVVQQQNVDRLRREIAGLRQHSAATVPNQPKAAPKPRSEAVLSAEQTANAQPFAWQTVEADDYGTYIANLRGLGCPEQPQELDAHASITRSHWHHCPPHFPGAFRHACFQVGDVLEFVDHIIVVTQYEFQ